MKNGEIRILYYYEIPLRNTEDGIEKVEPYLTFDKEFAETQQGFRIGDLETLDFLGCCGIWFRDERFEIEKGIVEYYEIWGKNEVFGERILVDVGYRIIE